MPVVENSALAGIENRHPTLTEQQGQDLVALARQTLATALKRQTCDDERARVEDRLQDDVFQAPCGAFVTLMLGGHLRGCIGSLTAREALVDCVRSNAINAAFNDPRFKPLKPSELERITIEVSVLTVPQPLAYDNVDDLLGKLRPKVDGVTIRKKLASATFLPQVWEQLPKKEDFLSQLCLKAGLSADAWRDADLDIETYQVQYFEEA